MSGNPARIGPIQTLVVPPTFTGGARRVSACRRAPLHHTPQISPEITGDRDQDRPHQGERQKGGADPVLGPPTPPEIDPVYQGRDVGRFAMQTVPKDEACSDPPALLRQEIDPPQRDAGERPKQPKPHKPVRGSTVQRIPATPGQDIEQRTREPQRQGEMDCRWVQQHHHTRAARLGSHGLRGILEHLVDEASGRLSRPQIVRGNGLPRNLRRPPGVIVRVVLAFRGLEVG